MIRLPRCTRCGELIHRYQIQLLLPDADGRFSVPAHAVCPRDRKARARVVSVPVIGAVDSATGSVTFRQGDAYPAVT